MILRGVPEFLEALRNLTPENRANLVPVQNWETLTVGYRLSAVTFEISMSDWRRHYRVAGLPPRERFNGPVSTQAMAMSQWKADLRKILPAYGPAADPEIPWRDLIEASVRRDIPTAWARLLEDDD